MNSSRLAVCPYNAITTMSFQLYTTEEVKEMSVKELNNPQTFDPLMNPNIGGLYDPIMGPTDRQDLCHTCELNELNCPGHYAHLSLPLPVYNPVFFTLAMQLLKGSCTNCHRVICSSASVPATLLVGQLKCLDKDNFAAVDELREIVSQQLCVVADLDIESETTKASGSLARSMANSVTSSVTEAIDKVLKRLETSDVVLEKRNINTRNCVELRQTLVKQFLDSFFNKRSGKCPHCRSKLPQIRHEAKRRVVIGSVSAAAKKTPKLSQLKKEEDFDNELLPDEDGIEDVLNEQNRERRSQSKSILTGQSSDTSKGQHTMTPLEMKVHFQKLWDEDQAILKELFPIFRETPKQEGTKVHSYPTDLLFFDVLCVCPTKFRPLSRFKEQTFENPRTANLKKILTEAKTLKILMKASQKKKITEEEKVYMAATPGKTASEKLDLSWMSLQTKINALYDEAADMGREKLPGIRQVLEKKEGVFRKFMMGKRVNYAARSVISPDPYMEIDEVGVPEIFAKKLTFPEAVAAHNLHELKKAVINGPDKYPGASFVINEDGTKVMLSATDKNQRVAIAKSLFSHANKENIVGSKKVLRHLKVGDVMLMNRQPSLHKPSIMAHRARVLKGERTFRLNYAACKTYNADFDGDEMNAHLPQNEVARAEGYEIVGVPHQYLVPKDGTPISGLIQDHVVSGVMLTLKDQFFNREDYQHLVYSAFPNNHQQFKTLPPAILKPGPWWTGKQVVSTVILNVIPKGATPLSFFGKAKTALKNWQVSPEFPIPKLSMSESEVVIRSGELLCGVLDKAHYGPTSYSLVHYCFELYGAKVAASLQSCFARLFTSFLQIHGFSLGVEDILVSLKADKSRKKVVGQLRSCGPGVGKKSFGLPETATEEELTTVVRKAFANTDQADMKQLDYSMKVAMDDYNEQINKCCIPHGLIKRFPQNGLQLMIESGAKGSMVNSMQISCLLGQIELEGSRPPIMVSGRSLPSFRPFDPTPRAGGFVDQRFLTGIRPQEYFFHCMAGREGLIDTAVKTSRSGYLQRCIIKHLEGLVVGYDLTVRDSDNSIVQFQYGEDSLDVCKVPFLSVGQFPFLIDNHESLVKPTELAKLKESMGDGKRALKHFKKIRRWKRENPAGRKYFDSPFLRFCNDVAPNAEVSKLVQWGQLDQVVKDRYIQQANSAVCPPPVSSVQRPPDEQFLSIPESMLFAVKKYEDDNKVDGYVRGKSQEIAPDNFYDMVGWKVQRSLVDPGEPVGLLAAQSIGEPSTQMTLNTFHFAGRGEMNVTLGIPRLREILMVASRNIATPAAECPALPGISKDQVEAVRRKLDRIYLKDTLKSVIIEESVKSSGSAFYRMYTITITLLSSKRRPPHVKHISSRQVLMQIEKNLLKSLGHVIKKQHEEVTHMKQVHSRSKGGATEGDRLLDSGSPDENDGGRAKVEDEGKSSDEEGPSNDADAGDERLRQRHNDAGNDYVGEDEEAKAVEAEMPPSSSEESDADDNEGEAQNRSDPIMFVDDSLLVTTKLSSRTDKRANEKRISVALQASKLMETYEYDVEKDHWCKATLRVTLNASKLDISKLVDQELKKCVIQSVPGVQKCILSEDKGRLIIKTQGVNLGALYAHADVLDIRKLYTNDIHVMAETLGIEAANKAIVREMKNVFGSYGIGVDHRHLSLIGDYMTQTGRYRAFNRLAMDSAASPIQKMSFETTMQFLKSAIIFGQIDELESPSARLVVGKLTKGGTGCFDLLVK